MKSLIVVGASGVGKGTIIRHLLARTPLLQLVLSFTTRPIRPTEQQAVDYYFVNHQIFQTRLHQMLEHKTVFKNSYGTSKTHLEQILKNGKIPVLDIDIEGMMEIKQKINCEIICVMPAGWDLLKQRLSARKTESKEVLEMRLEENKEQVQKMLKLQGTPGIWFTTNYQFQSTCFGIEKWLQAKFPPLILSPK